MAGFCWLKSFGLYFISGFATFATAWWMYLFIPMHIVMGPIHGTIVNWFAHKFGYTNYEVDDTSKNLMPFDIFMLEKVIQQPSRQLYGQFARKWYEIDPIYPIGIMDWVGLMNKSGSITQLIVTTFRSNFSMNFKHRHSFGSNNDLNRQTHFRH